MYRVVIIDDHSVVRSGIRGALLVGSQIEVVGECASAEQILPVLETENPDIIFLDLRIPNGKGGLFKPISGIREIKAKFPQIKIVVISAYLNITILEESLASDIRGYILKDDLIPEDLPEIVCSTMRGKLTISATVKEFYRRNQYYPALTKRHIQIIECIASNLDVTGEQLADNLHITAQTLRNQLRTIYRAMGVANKTHCIAMAMALGIIQPPDHRFFQVTVESLKMV